MPPPDAGSASSARRAGWDRKPLWPAAGEERQARLREAAGQHDRTWGKPPAARGPLLPLQPPKTKPPPSSSKGRRQVPEWRQLCGHILPRPRSETSYPAPTMMWSCNVRPRKRQPFWISLVIARSASDGGGSPDGGVGDEDGGGGGEDQRALDHFARIDRHMVHRTDRHPLVGNQPVLAVEIEDVEPLLWSPHRDGTIVADGGPGGQDRVVIQIAAKDFAGLEDYGFFLRGHGINSGECWADPRLPAVCGRQGGLPGKEGRNEHAPYPAEGAGS